MRQDEEFCKTGFDVYLKSKVSPRSIRWIPGNREVAPDYFLAVGDKHFVVEVTTLMEQVSRGKERIPAQGIYKFTREYVEKLEAAALKKEILSGTYFIYFPMIHVDVHKVKKKLIKPILEFIAETQNMLRSEQTSISIDEVKYCNIQKISEDGAKLILSSYPASVSFQDYAQREACRVLNEIVENKMKRLADLDSEKILLVLVLSPLVEPENLKNCISQIADIQNFHTIFAIGGWGNSSHMLYTKNPLWL